MSVEITGARHSSRTLASGPLSLSAYLRAQDVSITYLDYSVHVDEIEDVNVEHFVSLLGDHAPVVGIGCMNNMLPFALFCAAAIKRRRPKTIVILGGPGPSGIARDLFACTDAVDYVVSGEGEYATHTLLTALAHSTSVNIPGVMARNTFIGFGKLEKDDLVKHMDQLPEPAYDLVNLGNYDHVGITTARGCPYRCSFCDSPAFWTHSFRRRSVNGVAGEIERLYAIHLRERIHIWDDTLLVDKRRVLALCSELRSRGLPIQWHAYARVDEIDEAYLVELAKAGCYCLFFGIESGSDQVLATMKKGFKVEKVLAALAMAKRIIGNVQAGFIWGFPYESMRDFELTVRLIHQLREIGVMVRCVPLNPCPNSSLYDAYKEQLEYRDDFQPYLIRFRSPQVRKAAQILITSHPRAFPNFWSVKSELFSHKLALVRELALENPNTFLLSTY